MARCFVGVMLSQEIRKGVKCLQDWIKSLPIECKLVEDYNLHVCLSFLGEVGEDKIIFFSQLLDKICEKYNSFKVNIVGIKLIPSERYVRVIALGVVDSEIFERLRKEIVEKIGGDSKPLHVTLCRVRNVLNKQKFLSEIKKNENIQVGSFVVDRVQIIKSELQRTGPIYSVIHESKLLEV
ncbi:MAG: RNA 2',3'-cyclic phosphodiesterase [Candidatus Aenigmarchaeota archaeon]|nr:RNA 2',3'-cyclic phosphodiesterase [Candidatus Aenigmarchaeota archaeon]